MQLDNNSQKARDKMNEFDEEFSMDQIANRIGCKTSEVSWMTSSLVRQKHIKLSRRAINPDTKRPQSFYIRLRKIPPTREQARLNSVMHKINTTAPWYQFCFNKKAA